MLLELDEIEKKVATENYYLGTSDLETSKADVASLPENSSPITRGTALGYLAWNYLCCGMEREAISTFEKARSLFLNHPGGRSHPELTKIEESMALAYLRLAENQNCCSNPNPDSCIFPIRGEAIHSRKEGAEKALALLKIVLAKREPDSEMHLEERWLANLALMILGRSVGELPEAWQIPSHFASPGHEGFPAFTNIAARAGVNTFGLSGGAVADDFDGDGNFDLVVSEWDPARGMKYFRGRGDGTFEDLTSHSNLEQLRGGLNLKQVDFDNDGDLDIYVMRGAWLGSGGRHPNSLLRNNGVSRDGYLTFTDVTFAVGLGENHYPGQTADWADFDLDGDLDLFVGNETTSERFPCQLFRNEGLNSEGIPKFIDIAKVAGVESYRFVKGCSWGDFDGDRYPDLFLSCIDQENLFWRNRGDGTFEDITAATGTSLPIKSFPTWFWDYNNDGFLDLFVSDYSGGGAKVFLHARGEPMPGPSHGHLYENDGRGGFRRVDQEVGLTMPMMPMGSNFGDLSNNGFPDMYLGTGNPRFSSIVPNLLISNEEGNFVDRTAASRLGHLQKGHAVSLADFDRDGDLDIFEQMGGAYRCDPFYDALYENPGTRGNGWLSVRLIGVKSNSRGVGARVRVVVVENGTERSIFQWMNSGGSFGANPLELHFGLARASVIDRVEIFWPLTGKTQIVRKISPDRRIKIKEES